MHDEAHFIERIAAGGRSVTRHLVARNRPNHSTSALSERRLSIGVAALCRKDSALRRIVTAYGYPPLWARRPGFSALARIILEQQVSLASGKAIYDRVRRSLGGMTPLLVARCGTRGLRRLGVTRQKSSYLVGLARSIIDGSLVLPSVARDTTDAARGQLQAIKGIGPWTADVYLIMALRRPDVWPTGDLAIHIAMQRFLRLRRRPTTESASRIARRWSPWRAVAARILWHGYLSERRNGRKRV